MFGDTACRLLLCLLPGAPSLRNEQSWTVGCRQAIAFKRPEQEHNFHFTGRTSASICALRAASKTHVQTCRLAALFMPLQLQGTCCLPTGDFMTAAMQGKRFGYFGPPYWGPAWLWAPMDCGLCPVWHALKLDPCACIPAIAECSACCFVTCLI